MVMMPSHNKAQKNVAKALATTVVASVLAPTSMAVAAALPSPADVTKLASQVATPDVVAAALEVGGTASGKAILGALDAAEQVAYSVQPAAAKKLAGDATRAILAPSDKTIAAAVDDVTAIAGSVKGVDKAAEAAVNAALSVDKLKGAGVAAMATDAIGKDGGLDRTVKAAGNLVKAVVPAEYYKAGATIADVALSVNSNAAASAAESIVDVVTSVNPTKGKAAVDKLEAAAFSVDTKAARKAANEISKAIKKCENACTSADVQPAVNALVAAGKSADAKKVDAALDAIAGAVQSADGGKIAAAAKAAAAAGASAGPKALGAATAAKPIVQLLASQVLGAPEPAASGGGGFSAPSVSVNVNVAELAIFAGAPVLLGSLLLSSFKITPGSGNAITRAAPTRTTKKVVATVAPRKGTKAVKKTTAAKSSTPKPKPAAKPDPRIVAGSQTVGQAKLSGGTVTVYRRSSF